jgi:hypothetical protein
MPQIEYISLKDNTHYRDIKRIFRDSFDTTHYSWSNIIRAWKFRDPSVSFAFYSTKTKSIIGFVLAYYMSKAPNGLYISYIALQESERGVKLGTSIMRGFVSHYVSYGCSVSLVASSLEIESWYLRNGFNKSGCRHLLTSHPYKTRIKSKQK